MVGERATGSMHVCILCHFIDQIARYRKAHFAQNFYDLPFEVVVKLA